MAYTVIRRNAKYRNGSSDWKLCTEVLSRYKKGEKFNGNSKKFQKLSTGIFTVGSSFTIKHWVV
jgi:hypothetical protein